MALDIKRDSDSPSDDERNVAAKPVAFEKEAVSALPTDPDDGLSDTERAKIVSFSLHQNFAP